MGKTIGLDGVVEKQPPPFLNGWNNGNGGMVVLACAFWPSQIWKHTTKYYWDYCGHNEFGNVAKIEMTKMPTSFARFIKAKLTAFLEMKLNCVP